MRPVARLAPADFSINEETLRATGGWRRRLKDTGNSKEESSEYDRIGRDNNSRDGEDKDMKRSSSNGFSC